MSSIVDATNNIVWAWMVIPLLLGAGLYFTIRSRFIQFRNIGHTLEVMRRSFHTDGGGISSFGAFATGLAARVGTGNVAGVALAITVGGPGAVFWMWLLALLGMSTSFAENTLAQLFKERDAGGIFRGGPAYYMEHGLGLRWMGTLFAIFLILSFGFAFNAVQANSMTDSLRTAFGANRAVTGGVIVIFAALVIFGGIRRIAHFAQAVVPSMAIAYLLVALFVVVRNIPELPGIGALIVRSAFGFEQAAGGGLGWAVSKAIMQGVRRGLFSNEAGMGSSPNAAATAEVKHPAAQGFIQMLGVFSDTIIICTCTASIILLSGLYQPDGELTGVPLTQASLSAQVGGWGSGFVAIILQFFAFTSIVANYYFGETSVLFIAGTRRVLAPFRLIVLGFVMFGSVAQLQTVWTMANVSMGFMALLNIVAILLLSPIAIKVMRDYTAQLGGGDTPVFDPDKFPEVGRRIDRDVW